MNSKKRSGSKFTKVEEDLIMRRVSEEEVFRVWKKTKDGKDFTKLLEQAEDTSNNMNNVFAELIGTYNGQNQGADSNILHRIINLATNTKCIARDFSDQMK